MKDLQVAFNCLANTAGSTDQVEVAISYTGMDENALIVNNGKGDHRWRQPRYHPNGTILVTGLTEGDSWDITITGGYNGSCLLESSGTVPSDYCRPAALPASVASSIKFA
ncbi:MAG: hypothetical protein IPL49_17995 [Saprospirales bacterium]|nr:hypothetical protein [Saprospirales bacterium]